MVSRADNQVITYLSPGLFGGKSTRERGRVQIWQPRILERPRPDNQQGGDSSKHRKSVATGSSTAVSFAKTFSTAHTSPVQSEGFTSYNFLIPGLPMLVLYLEPDANGKENVSFLSLLSKCILIRVRDDDWYFSVDEKTMLKDHSCSCGRKRTNCIHSTIEKPKELVAQRVQAERDGEELNLALLGTYQKPKHSELIKGMKWIQIHFKTHDERVKFEKMYAETKIIYKKKLAKYHEEMRQTKADHEGLDRYEWLTCCSILSFVRSNFMWKFFFCDFLRWYPFWVVWKTNGRQSAFLLFFWGILDIQIPWWNIITYRLIFIIFKPFHHRYRSSI